jgi:hypothetical protein
MILRRVPVDRIRMGQNPLPISPKRLISCNLKELISMKIKKAMKTTFATISSLFIKNSIY